VATARRRHRVNDADHSSDAHRATKRVDEIPRLAGVIKHALESNIWTDATSVATVAYHHSV